MKFKDKFVFASIACALLCIWCTALFFLITSTAWLRPILAGGAILFLIGLMSCLRAIGEIGLWEHEETRKVAEARFRYGYMFRGWLF